MKILFSLLLLISTNAYSASVNYPLIKNIVEGLSELQQQSSKIHSSYNLRDIKQKQACLKANVGQQTKAKALKIKLKEIKSFGYRYDMQFASNAAIACVSCEANRVADCSRLPKILSSINQQLRKDKQ